MESFSRTQSFSDPAETPLIAADRLRRRPAQALFDRDGHIRAWDPDFLREIGTASEAANAGSIFEMIPEIDAAGWTSIWARIDTGDAYLLRLSKRGGDSGATGLFIHNCQSEGGGLAVLTLVTGDREVDRQILHRLQHEVLEAVASGWSLRQVADLICRRAEQLVPNVICSVLTLDPENRLRTLAAPSLPESYCRAIDGCSIGPQTGSCGTAAFRGEPVIVTDIASDPLWADFRDLALPLGLRSCWSSPIRGPSGAVTGTFAFYYRTERRPDRLDREIVDICLHLCAIAIEHEETQQRIRKLALSDPLTGLPNRAQFQQHASDLMKVLSISERSLAVLYIDLDEFKSVNDTLGHWAGDLLLTAAADRLRSCCRPGEMVARLGGDEFAVLQFPVRNAAGVEDLAMRILAAFAAPFDIEDRKIAIGATVGIAQAPRNGASFMEILKCADVALYHAKRSGGGTFQFFTDEMGRHLFAVRSMEDELRNAVAAGEITPYYQPIVDIHSGDICGFEALARWLHPRRGIIPPSEFIMLAEHAGIIGTLGNFILAEACAQATKWPANLKLAVNLTPSQLVRPSFALDVVTILGTSGLAAHRLQLEITEAVRLSENAAMRKALTDLQALGIGIVLDDFGSGASSLAYLRAFPFDKVKLDLDCIGKSEPDASAKAIGATLLSLAANLGMTTAAEEVEMSWQEDWLREQNCGEAQGFLFGGPMPGSDVLAFLAGRASDGAMGGSESGHFRGFT